MYFRGIEHSVRLGIGVIRSHWQLAPPSRNDMVRVLKQGRQNDDIEHSILSFIRIPNVSEVESIN